MCKWRQLPWLHLFGYSQLCVFNLNAWMGVNGSNRRWIMYVLIGVMCHVNGTRFHGKWGKHQQNGRKRLITFIKGDSTQHYICNLLFDILLGVLVLNHIISERILTSHTMPIYNFYILLIAKKNCSFSALSKQIFNLTFVKWSFCWHSGLLCATYYFAACFLCIREFATRKISFNFTVQQTLCWHCFWWPPNSCTWCSCSLQKQLYLDILG